MWDDCASRWMLMRLSCLRIPLADEFQELELLVSWHVDGCEEMEMLGEWRKREDYVQFPEAVDAESMD